jgi:sugar (pentulose or hexulose) kinase
MSKFIGIDLGTTSITAVLIDIGSVDDPDRHPVRRQLSVDNQSQRDRPEHPIYSEWDLDQMINSAFGLLADLVDGMPTQEIAGIGVTGQVHGMALLDERHRPYSAFIGWQDQRGNEIHSDDLTYVQRMRLVADSTKLGSRPSTGYMGTTLFRFSEKGQLPAKTQTCFAPDYLVGQLCQSPPVTDPTNAASSGLFNLQTNSWEADSLQSLGLPITRPPPVIDACTVVGPVKKLTPLAGIPVSVACGDNQASFLRYISVIVNMNCGG